MAERPTECFVFARGETAPARRPSPAECEVRTAPASTFKIPHALIALQSGVISADEVVRWDGTAHRFDTWRRDHTVDSAIKWSVLPFFQRTAQLLGGERMREGLKALQYAADTFDGDVRTFWLNGDLVVSPAEQLTFLQRLFAGRLPMTAANSAVVANALRMPNGRILLAAGSHPFSLDWPTTTIVHAKTGNTQVRGEYVSWLVGALELEGTRYVFAARARSRARLEATAGADVARRGFNKALRESLIQPGSTGSRWR